jgi:flavin reductase (DIM6/NTAB) family NADH-FMN oxidoreductase RutF
MTVSLDLFAQGMRKLAASVTVITTVHEGVRYGLTASAVTSLSAQPPSLLACINKQASACAPIDTARKFTVNILSKDQAEISSAFSSDVADRFAHGLWDDSPMGLPYLRGAAANFECSVMDALPGFTHDIFVGLITDIQTSQHSSLLYAAGEYGHFQLPPK